MLEEAVEVMRELWRGGFVDHHGRHYTVENARLYTLPKQEIPVYISGFGPQGRGPRRPDRGRIHHHFTR